MSADTDSIDTEIAGEAADWILRFQEQAPGENERQAFERWRTQSPQHAAVWGRAETVLQTVGQVPPQVGRDAMKRLRALNRRQALRALAGLIVAAPAALSVGQRLPEWRADLRTARGERKTVELADGSRLMLNTASSVDVVMTSAQSLLRLHVGEILVTTPARTRVPFVVETMHGAIRTDGARFSIRRDADFTRASVFESRVAIAPLRASRFSLNAGGQVVFTAAHVGDTMPVAATDALWERGLFAANRLRLADLIAELGRYRSGVMRCHPAVADMRVSGTFPVGNDDAALTLLAKTLPLRIRNVSRYWVSIEPARA